MKPTRSSRAAFTLVELLAVMAILGILVAITLPAVQASRESARRAQCANNLHQIGIAIPSYIDAFGKSPDAGTVLHNFTAYLEGQGIGKCPTLSTVAVTTTSTSTVAAGSYGVNMCLQRMMVNDSDKIVMTDGATELLEYEGLDQTQWNQSIAPRHNGVLNCLFFDGHVDTRWPDAINPYAIPIVPPQDANSVVLAMWRPDIGTCTTCGGGLLGTYYEGNNNEWNGASYTRVDATITYPFGGNGSAYNEPPSPVDPTGTSYPPWTATWTGQIRSNTTEPYTFWVRVDNEIWVYIDGQLVVTRNTGGGACQDWQASAQPVSMAAGQWHDIQIKFQQFDYGSPGHVSIQWSSPSLPQQVIPTCNMRSSN